MVGDEGNNISIFLALNIAGTRETWTNSLILISNFVALKPVLVSILVTHLSNLFNSAN